MNTYTVTGDATIDRDALARDNLPLAKHYLKMHPCPVLPPEESMQAAYLGLVEAAHRYDPGRGVRFSTFAMARISKSVASEAADRHLIRLPKNLLSHLKDAERRVAEPGRRGAEARWALGLAGQIRAALRTQSGWCDSDGDCPLDRVEARRGEDGGTGTDVAEKARRILSTLFESLPPRRRTVMELRYGLTGRPPMTPKEVAAELGIGVKTVRDHHDKALAALRDLAANAGHEWPVEGYGT